MTNFGSASIQELQQNVRELIGPLQQAIAEWTQVSEISHDKALGLIAGEATMVALLLTNADGSVTVPELSVINDLREAVFGAGLPKLVSTDYLQLSRQLVRQYPKLKVTLDHTPTSVSYLTQFDTARGTNHADDARSVFIDFTAAVVSADQREHFLESIVLANFKDALGS